MRDYIERLNTHYIPKVVENMPEINKNNVDFVSSVIGLLGYLEAIDFLLALEDKEKK